jgi:hypothetical protein
MDETYRMLGREHEADLEREALKRRLAAEATRGMPTATRPREKRRGRLSRLVARVTAMLTAAGVAVVFAGRRRAPRPRIRRNS